MNLLLTALLFVLIWAEPAHAEPITTAIVTLVKSVSIANIIGRIVLGALLSKWSQRRAKKQQRGDQGVEVPYTRAGGVNPDRVPAGWCATGGILLSPPLSHGEENRYLTYVFSLSAVPIQEIRRLFFDGVAVEIGWEEPDHLDYGKPILGDYAGYAWIKSYDGSQTEADPGLLRAYADHPDYPWSSNMVGVNRAYAIVTLYRNPELMPSPPDMRLELIGARFYDPRKDDTQPGGAGTHRWADQTTWEATRNPVVMIYNLRRGYDLSAGHIYGGQIPGANLPVANWAAAMNTCDITVPGFQGVPVKQFRAGLDIDLSRSPKEIEDVLLDACGGSIAEDGVNTYIQVGPPELPSMFITDADVLVSHPEEATPKPGLNDRVNGISVTHPLPAQAWEPSEARPIFDAELEAEDAGYRLPEDLPLEAVPYRMQAKRLARGYLDDARRFRRHDIQLGPSAAGLRPFSTIAWDSDEHGYSGKLFQIGHKNTDLFSYQSAVGLRETDPNDFATVRPEDLEDDELGNPITPISALILTGVYVEAFTVIDTEGVARKPGIRAHWQPLVDGKVRAELRLAADESPVTARLVDARTGQVEFIGEVLPATAYEVRLTPTDTSRPVAGTDWLPVSTDDLRVSSMDLDDLLNHVLGNTQSFTDMFGSFRFAFDRVAAADLEGRLSAYLEGERLEGKVDGQRVEFSAEIEGVRATLTQDFYTAATVDSALSALTTGLTTQIDDLESSVNQQLVSITDQQGAFAGSITSVETSVGGLTTSVDAVIQSVDGIGAVWGVQVNNNGYITGAGLISDIRDGVPVSDFNVVADALRVGAPNGSGGFHQPFVFKTTGSMENGIFVPAGAYLDAAFIRAASVGTLEIAGDAVSAAQTAVNRARLDIFYTATPVWRDVLTITHVEDHPATVTMSCATVYGHVFGDFDLRLVNKTTGQVIWGSRRFSNMAGQTNQLVVSGNVTPSAAGEVYALQHRNVSNNSGQYTRFVERHGLIQTRKR